MSKIARARSILIHGNFPADSWYFEGNRLCVTNPAGMFLCCQRSKSDKILHMDGVGRLWSETPPERFAAIAAHELDPQA